MLTPTLRTIPPISCARFFCDTRMIRPLRIRARDIRSTNVGLSFASRKSSALRHASACRTQPIFPDSHQIRCGEAPRAILLPATSEISGRRNSAWVQAEPALATQAARGFQRWSRERANAFCGPSRWHRHRSPQSGSRLPARLLQSAHFLLSYWSYQPPEQTLHTTTGLTTSEISGPRSSEADCCRNSPRSALPYR